MGSSIGLPSSPSSSSAFSGLFHRQLKTADIVMAHNKHIQDLADALRSLDPLGDGTLTFEEFCRGVGSIIQSSAGTSSPGTRLKRHVMRDESSNDVIPALSFILHMRLSISPYLSDIYKPSLLISIFCFCRMSYYSFSFCAKLLGGIF